MKFYKIRTAMAAWVLGTHSGSIRRYIGHFEYRKHPGQIPMACPRCSKAIPPGAEAWVGVVGGTEKMATCVGCADA